MDIIQDAFKSREEKIEPKRVFQLTNLLLETGKHQYLRLLELVCAFISSSIDSFSTEEIVMSNELLNSFNDVGMNASTINTLKSRIFQALQQKINIHQIDHLMAYNLILGFPLALFDEKTFYYLESRVAKSFKSIRPHKIAKLLHKLHANNYRSLLLFSKTLKKMQASIGLYLNERGLQITSIFLESNFSGRFDLIPPLLAFRSFSSQPQVEAWLEMLLACSYDAEDCQEVLSLLKREDFLSSLRAHYESLGGTTLGIISKSAVSAEDLLAHQQQAKTVKFLVSMVAQLKSLSVPQILGLMMELHDSNGLSSTDVLELFFRLMQRGVLGSQRTEKDEEFEEFLSHFEQIVGEIDFTGMQMELQLRLLVLVLTYYPNNEEILYAVR